MPHSHDGITFDCDKDHANGTDCTACAALLASEGVDLANVTPANFALRPWTGPNAPREASLALIALATFPGNDRPLALWGDRPGVLLFLVLACATSRELAARAIIGRIRAEMH